MSLSSAIRNFIAPVAFLALAILTPSVGCYRRASPDAVATVNGKEISRSELEGKYRAFKDSHGASYQVQSPEQANILRLAILRQMIDEEILQQRAVKLNVAASDEDVNAELTAKKAPYTQEEFDRQLRQHNETLEHLKSELRHSLTENILLNKEIASDGARAKPMPSDNSFRLDEDQCTFP